MAPMADCNCPVCSHQQKRGQHSSHHDSHVVKIRQGCTCPAGIYSQQDAWRLTSAGHHCHRCQRFDPPPCFTRVDYDLMQAIRI